mgnify:CR=1 FL=1
MWQKRHGKGKGFRVRIYFHRGKEENWELEEKAKELGFRAPEEVAYLGYEIGMDVEVSENGRHKVLTIQGVDVSDKNIYI